jgi:hypothetical protein
MAMLQPGVIGEQAMPSSKTSRLLDPEEIKLLMKQGEQLIAAGDVATARTVLRRAADAGHANAAIALGATYDPNVLARLGVVGVSAEVEKARNWYQKAEALGSPDARRRLDLLEISSASARRSPPIIRVYFDLRALDRARSGRSSCRGPKDRLRDAPLF